MRPMRVLMVSNLWPPEVVGGAELYAGALAARLRAAGHEVGVVTLGVAGPDVVGVVPPWPYPIQTAAEQSAAPRALFHAADLYQPRARAVLDRVLGDFAPDVVHSHVVQGLSTVALTRPARRGVAHVHTIHDYWLLCQRNSMVQRDGTACATRCRSCRAVSWVRNEAVRRAPPEVLLAVSRAVAREHEVLPWTRDRMRVVYNPVERVERARPAPPGEGSPLTFGFLGRLAADKGLGTLLDAFARLGRTDVRLVVAGRGPLEAAARAAPGVEYAGWVSGAAKEALLDRVDCLVVPSEWKDPAPLVVNEARARGIPVVGATIGGIPELVAAASRPLAFRPGDAGALADRLATFAGDPARFRAPPEAAPSDWAGHLDAVLAAYRDAREQGGRPRGVGGGHPGRS
jgi:glycosyltransferase involved in cell wall biosynthesis